MDKNFTMIPSQYINKHEKMESDQLLLLSILLQNRTNKDTCMFNMVYLCERLLTTTKNTNRVNFIIETLKYFEEKNILFFSDNYNCKNQINIEMFTRKSKTNIIFAETYEEINDNFTILYDKELDDIITYCKINKLSKHQMVHLFLYIVKGIKRNKQDEDYKLTYPSIKTMADELDISETTIIKYLKSLREMELLYYDNVGYKISNGKFKSTSTYYSRYEDREYVMNMLNKISNDKGIRTLDSKGKSKINQKRSLKQKINKLNKKIIITKEDKLRLDQLQEEYENL